VDNSPKISRRLNGLDLFSGIGGNSLGLRQYTKTIAYCEQDRHAQSILLSRMSEGAIESAPIWDDVTTLTGNHFDVPIEIIVAGFPCQDTSTAGHQVGVKDGKRSGLFFHAARLMSELEPEFVFLENVHGILSSGGIDVVQEITNKGYDFRWCILSAEDVGAYHQRKRWFGLAHRKRSKSNTSSYTEHDGSFRSTVRRSPQEEISDNSKGKNGVRQFEGSGSLRVLSPELVQRDELLQRCKDAWDVESRIPRNTHEVSYQVDRI